MTRKSLSDILREGDRQSLSRAWGETKAAEDFAPLPTGEYDAGIIVGELFTSRNKGTAGYKLTFTAEPKKDKTERKPGINVSELCSEALTSVLSPVDASAKLLDVGAVAEMFGCSRRHV